MDRSKVAQFVDKKIINNPIILFLASETIDKKIADKIIARSTYEYKLREDFKPKDISKVVLPPELKQKYSNVDVQKYASKCFYDALAEFIQLLSTKFSKEYLINFYNNINSVNIKTKDLEHSDCSGYYLAEKNSITLDSNECISIYHELFHMASSVFKDKYVYSGFRQHGKYCGKNLNIGKGINEGYTQLLTERYFGHIDGIMYRSYIYCTSIMGKIEGIIGKDKMEKLYFSSDLPGLLNELKKYASDEEIMSFVSGMDFLVEHLYEEKILSQKAYSYMVDSSLKNVNDFLFMIYYRNLSSKLNNGKIKREDFCDQLIGIFTDICFYKDYFKISDEVKKKIKKCFVYHRFCVGLKSVNDDIFEDFVGFSYEVSILNKLSKIVDKEKLKDFYFNDDLSGLMDELRKYASLDEVNSFVSDIKDLFGDLEWRKHDKDESYISPKIGNVHVKKIHVNDFIFQMYYKKNKSKFDSGEITNKDLCNCFRNFLGDWFYYGDYSDEVIRTICKYLCYSVAFNLDYIDCSTWLIFLKETGYYDDVFDKAFVLRFLSEMIDVDQVENFYFNNDLSGLVQNLKDYASLDDLNNFVSKMEVFYKSFQKDLYASDEYKEIYEKICEHLLLMYCRYIRIGLENNGLINNNRLTKLNSFINHRRLKVSDTVKQQFIKYYNDFLKMNSNDKESLDSFHVK